MSDQTEQVGLEHPAAGTEAELIEDDITHYLGHSWFFDPMAITVAVSGGHVALKGIVRSARERRMAAAAAWSHEGVVSVDNQLEVKD